MRRTCLFCALAVLLAACAGPTTAVVPTSPPASTAALPTPTPLPSATPLPTTTPRPLPSEYPLSGLPADPAYLLRPPLAVMIPSDAEPYGLSQASLVLEAAVEYQIPRFLAIFEQVDATQIGPVRSTRPYFVDWACPYGVLFVHWGGSPQALATLGTSDCLRPLDGQTYGQSYFFHQEDLQVPWNSEFSSSELLYGYLENWEITRTVDFRGYEHQTCVHTAIPPTQTVSFSFDQQVRYTYSPRTDTYAREYGGRPHLDGLTGQQIAVDNLVLIFVPQNPLPGDDAGRIEMQTSGEGEALVLTCGAVLRGRWVKESPQTELRFLDEQDREIPFAPGSIWIEVLAPGQEVSLEGAAFP